MAAVAGWLAPDNKAQAQTNLSAPTNVQVADGDATGEVMVSWDAVNGAAGYSVRWVNVDVALAVYDAGGDWEQFIQSADVEGSDTTTYTVTVNRPRSGAEFAFDVGSRSGPDADPIWSESWERLVLQDVDEVLTAALAITRHANRLVDLGSIPTQGGMEDFQIARIGAGVNAQKAGVDQQLGALAGQGSPGRVRYIHGLVNRLKSNADMIQGGRTELRNELHDGAERRRELTARNSGRLFPAASASMDQQFYHVMTNFPEVGNVGMENISRADVLAYVHLTDLAANAILGHTLLMIANLMQDPTFVARIQETYDSVAGRLDKDVEYLSDPDNNVTRANADAIRLAQLMLNESRGDDSYFADLEYRLELVRTENNLRNQNAEILTQLLEQLDALTKEAQGMDAPAVPTIRPTEVGDPGITATEIHFGQSAALMGSNAALGTGMRDGIKAAFEEANRNGGVDGRQLRLTSENDFYEPDLAFEKTLGLIEGEDPVFALIGAVGTPTSRAALPLASSRDVPFVGPFTGAQFLREDDLTNVLNVRASYHEETEAMVARLAEAGVTKVAVLYQNDSYGTDGLTGVENALRSRDDMELVASWYYIRNSDAVESAAFRIAEEQPEAVIIIGTSAPAAEIIKKLRMKLGEDTIFLNVSFVGSNALATALGNEGEGVYMTQVVPLPSDESNAAVAAYRAALLAYDADAVPGFISLEGYLAGRLAIERLQACEADVSRECFLNVMSETTTIDLDGLQLQYGPGDNQGSDEVYLTRINADGEYERVDRIER